MRLASSRLTPPYWSSRCGGVQGPPDRMGWPGAGVGTLPASTTLASFGALFIPVDRLPRHPFPSSLGPPEMRELGRRRPPDPLVSPFPPERSGVGKARREEQRGSRGSELPLIQGSSPQMHALSASPRAGAVALGL